MDALLLGIAIAVATYAILSALEELREDCFGDGQVVARALHESRVLELLNANNRELEKRRRLAAAARDLRQAQRVYLMARGNTTPESDREALGQKVAEAAEVLDKVLAEVAR